MQVPNDSDPEVRRRAGELIPILETTGSLALSLLSLDVEQQTVAQILDELGRRTTYKFQQWGGNDAHRLYTFHLDKVPFWRAIDQISQTCGLVLQQGYGDEWLRFQAQDAVVPHIHYDGAFRFVATSFQYYRSVNLTPLPKSGPPSQPSESLTFSFSVFSEPRLPLLGIGQPVVEVAYDQDRRSLLPPNSGQTNNVVMGCSDGGNRSYQQQTTVTLNPTGERSRTLKFIRGVLPVTILLEQKPEVVTDNLLVRKGKDSTVGGVRFNIEDVTESPGPQYQIKMNLTNEEAKAAANDYSWQNSLHQRLEVQDGAGEQVSDQWHQLGRQWRGPGTHDFELSAAEQCQTGKADKAHLPELENAPAPGRLRVSRFAAAVTLRPLDKKSPPEQPAGCWIFGTRHQFTRSEVAPTPSRKQSCSNSSTWRGSVLCRCSPSVSSWSLSSRWTPACRRILSKGLKSRA